MTNIVVFRSLFCRFRNTIIVNRQFVATKPGFNRCVLFNRHNVVREVATGISRCSLFSTSNTSDNNINNNNSGVLNVTNSKNINTTAAVVSVYVIPSTSDCNNSPDDRKSDTSSSYRGNNINANNNDVKKKSASDSNVGNVDNHSKSLDGKSELCSVYVHPLSQIVLEYLQDCRHEWITEKGFDRSLTLHRDGSFEVKGSLSSVCITSDINLNGIGIVYKQNIFDGKNKNINNDNDRGSNYDKRRNTETTNPISIINETKEMTSKTTTIKSDSESISSTITDSCHVETTTTANQQQHNIQIDDNVRIWTSYDEEEKKHWLTARKGLFRQRFLLQDNLLSAWNGNRGSLPERIHVAVDGMIRAVDLFESRSQSTTQIEFPHQR